MLGWCPRPSLQHRTSGKSCLPQSHEIVHFSAFDDEKPVLQPPHQIVIGFDLGIEGSSRSLLTQACESPRSVLEPHHLRLRTHNRPHSESPRSPLSALGSLLADRTCDVGSSAIKTDEFAHAYNSALKSEHVACGNASDSVALSKHERVRASKNKLRESHPYSNEYREGRAKPHSSTIVSSDDEDDFDDIDSDTSKSIFSAASPVSSHSALSCQVVDFLSKCFRCRRRLVEGKDIYMYRGDQAFCSQECRYKQIVIDERKEKSSGVAPCFSWVTRDHTSSARVATLA